MQLFIHITNHVETVAPLLNKLMERGIAGATVVDCKGMLSAISESDVEPPPIFGSLREYLNPKRESGKMVFIALKDEDVPLVKEAVHEVNGCLKAPNTGILFTVPIMGWEGVPHK
ncbi:MAG: hypothetical protein Q4B99_06440 [Clostridia bacterium]|nr:hypothetical protein [Clostridia bacterium]